MCEVECVLGRARERHTHTASVAKKGLGFRV